MTTKKATTFARANVLLADEHDPERRQRHGDLGRVYQSWLQRLRPQLQCRCYNAYAGELPASIAADELYVISGSRMSAYDSHEWIQALSRFIVQLTKRRAPLLGICFGHQLIAQSLGGLVEKARVGWGAGVQDYHVADGVAFETDSFSSLVQHQDQVTRQPPNSQLVAGNDFCPNGALIYSDFPVASFQCHPEFTKELSRDIINSRHASIGADTSARALASLEREVDNDQIVLWVLEHLENWKATHETNHA